MNPIKIGRETRRERIKSAGRGEDEKLDKIARKLSLFSHSKKVELTIFRFSLSTLTFYFSYSCLFAIFMMFVLWKGAVCTVHLASRGL